MSFNLGGTYDSKEKMVVAVGTPVSQCPPRTDPYVRNYRIRLLPWVYNVKAFLWIWANAKNRLRSLGLPSVFASLSKSYCSIPTIGGCFPTTHQYLLYR